MIDEICFYKCQAEKIRDHQNSSLENFHYPGQRVLYKLFAQGHIETQRITFLLTAPNAFGILDL